MAWTQQFSHFKMGVALPHPSRRRPNIGRSLANYHYAYRLNAKIILKKSLNRSPVIKDFVFRTNILDKATHI